MEKNYYRVWQWEGMLWKKAILDTIVYYKTNKLVAIIGNLVGIAVTLFSVFKLRGVDAMYNELILLEAGLFGLLGTVIFYIFVHRMSAPVILYREKEKEAARHSWDDVTIIPHVRLENNDYGVVLEVVNKKPVPINRVELHVLSVLKKRESVFGRRNMQLIWIKNANLLKRKELIDIHPNESAFAVLANWSQNDAYIEAIWGNEDKHPSFDLEKDEEYIINIELVGSPSGHSLDNGPQFIGKLKYDGNFVNLIEIKRLI